MKLLDDLLRTLLNSLVIIWACAPLENEEDRSLPQTVTAILLLFLSRHLGSELARMAGIAWLQRLIRLLPTFFYLRWYKKRSWPESLYYGGIVWVGFYAASNISDVFFVSQGSLFLFFLLLSVLITGMLSRLTPMGKGSRIQPIRILTLLFIISSEVYLSQSIIAAGTGVYTPERRMITVFYQVLVIAILILLENYFYEQEEKYRADMTALASNYRYEALQARVSAEEDLHRLHHDMKHQLVLLEKLADDPNALRETLTKLRRQLSAYESRVVTGNTILDGILSEKLQQAKEKGITMEYKVDYADFSFLEPMEIASLFGNILDNALEAAAEAEGEKTIRLDVRQLAGNAVIGCRNPYKGKRHKVNGLIPTNKAETSLHGYGIPAIRQVAETHEGSVAIDLQEEGIFRISVFLPCPEPAGEVQRELPEEENTP